VVAVGIAIGSVTAAARVSLQRSLSVLPSAWRWAARLRHALIDFSRLPAAA